MPPLGTHAVHSEHLVYWFLDRGADPNACIRGWDSPMHRAAMLSSLSVIKLLRKHGGSVNHGVFQAAASSIERGRIEVLEFLLDEGALIDEVEYEWDPEIFKKNWARVFGTALHHAAKGGNEEVVDFLLLNGARQDIKDSKGKTPVEYAREKGHDKIAAILVQHEVR
ncbi:MAG: hypothetical protein Q9208_006646 [Pyrenodesmia sp. 3 TL-2023]